MQDDRQLRVQIDAHQCHLSRAEDEQILAAVHSLDRQVAHFPVADLHVLIERNARSNDYSVKLSLILSGQTLVGSEHDPQMLTALECCLSGLEENIRAYKDRLGRVPERRRGEEGTDMSLQPSQVPDPYAFSDAVLSGDYAAFRAAAVPYEESVRKRAGRLLQRHPDLDAQIGHKFEVADVVEEVFLDAFERFENWSREVRFGDWLEGLIEPAINELREHPDEELENINLARAAVAAERGEGVV